MIFRITTGLAVILFVIIGILGTTYADRAFYSGSEYAVETGYPDVYRTCCPGFACLYPPDCTQQYSYGIYGVDYDYVGGSGTVYAQCAGVIIANDTGQHVAKFAFRLHEKGTIKCGAPSYRWENLSNNGGLVHASFDIDFFDGAGT